MSTALAPADATFEEQRGLLFGVAYRMVGLVAEAEDIVQEAYLRFSAAQRPVENPRAFLVTVVTRLCLDYLKSARVQREQYIGPWLPEPVVSPAVAAPSPEHSVETAESVSFAFLVMLEELGPVERAVFLLREVFDYDYADIAQVVMKSEAACRQVFHRARQRLAERQHRHAASYDQRRELTLRFLAAANEGDMAGLLAMLSEDVVAYSDGGGKAAAAINPVLGPERIARFVIGIAKKDPPAFIEIADINGAPGVVMRRKSGRIDTIMLLEVSDGLVDRVYSIRNPEKLGRVG